MRKVLVLLFLLATTGVALTSFKSELLFPPNTKIGDIDLSYKTYDEGIKEISKISEKPVYFNLSNQSISPNYKDLGISFKPEALKYFLTTCFAKYFCVPTEKKTFGTLISIDKDKFESFIKSLSSQVSSGASAPVINFDEVKFYAQAPDAKFSLDDKDLLRNITPEKILSDTPLKINIIQTFKGNVSLQNEETEKLTEKVVSEPLLVKYGRQPVYIQKDELLNLTKKVTNDGRNEVVISESETRKLIDSLKSTYPVDIKLDEFYSIKAIQYALLLRAGEEKLNSAVILPLIGDPETNGKVAKKYIEINKSQQRLYTFEDGKQRKVYVVGTGLTAETPSGNFKILRKNRMSYSYYGNWYLPYMMPVGQFPNGNYFGIHEIPYHMDGAGNIYSRDENTMGSPATGGCIQMYKDDVIELWNWVEIGIPVIITD